MSEFESRCDTEVREVRRLEVINGAFGPVVGYARIWVTGYQAATLVDC